MGISLLASDSRITAQTIVDLATHTRSDVFPDFSSKLITTLYRIFPKPFSYAAFASVRIIMNIKKRPDVEGNVLQSSQEPLRVYGLPELHGVTVNCKKKLLLSDAIGIAAFFLGKQIKNRKINN